jgi:hypothetical protein
MKTIIIQIGNTDDKLTQMDWARFYADTNYEIQQLAHRVHFAAPSPAHCPWQNACWVIEIADDKALQLKALLVHVRRKFSQDSLAWTEGQTTFE